MKKKVILFGIITWEIMSIGIIYGLGGDIAPWIWNFNIFLLAPIASLSIVVQLAVLTIRLIKREKIVWNLLFLIMAVIIAYPITVLLGVSTLTYPLHEKVTEEFKMQLPISEGVVFGGKDYRTHAVWPSECYAYDIVKVPYNTESNELEDYGIYLADVKAPVSGTVIALKDTEDDILPNTEQFKSGLGNYIFIEIDKTGSYLILAHLEKNSITVAVGDYISPGMIIAKVGNSGTTSEPHLHIQHQKNNPLHTKIPICARGLPIWFEKNSLN